MRCCSLVQRYTANSSRRRPDGTPRYMDGDQCLNKAKYLDVDGDGWCALHAANETIRDTFGPFRPIPVDTPT